MDVDKRELRVIFTAQDFIQYVSSKLINFFKVNYYANFLTLAEVSKMFVYRREPKAVKNAIFYYFSSRKCSSLFCKDDKILCSSTRITYTSVHSNIHTYTNTHRGVSLHFTKVPDTFSLIPLAFHINYFCLYLVAYEKYKNKHIVYKKYIFLIPAQKQWFQILPVMLSSTMWLKKSMKTFSLRPWLLHKLIVLLSIVDCLILYQN